MAKVIGLGYLIKYFFLLSKLCIFYQNHWWIAVRLVSLLNLIRVYLLQKNPIAALKTPENACITIPLFISIKLHSKLLWRMCFLNTVIQIKIFPLLDVPYCLKTVRWNKTFWHVPKKQPARIFCTRFTHNTFIFFWDAAMCL